MKPLRVGIVCNEYPPDAFGGIGTFAAALAEELVQREHDVHVLGYSSLPGIRMLNGVEVEGIEAPVESRHPRLRAIQERTLLATRIKQWAKRVRPDIVESYDWKGYTAFFRSRAFPTIVRLEGSTAAYALMNGRECSALTRYFERRALRRADGIVACSKTIELHTERALGPLSTERRVVIPNFVSTEFFKPAPNVERNRNRIIYTGRISRNKGVDRLFAAIPRVFENCPEAELHLVGADTKEGDAGGSYLQQLLEPLSEPHRARVIHHGWTERSTLPELYTSAACAVFPSVAEAFGIVAIEAMACECPVVVSASTCFEEIVEPNKTGLIVDTANPSALAEAVTKLLSDNDLRSRLGQDARRAVVERFSSEAIIPRNVEFYRQCIEEYHSR